jgi:hypothetical protein
MSKERTRTAEFNCQLTRLTLVSCVAVYAGCSITKKEAQLPPLVRAERQLARAEKIRSDPQQKAAELLSVCKTAANEIPKISGEGDVNAEQPIMIYNRAAADLAAELPELTHGRNDLEL